MDTVCETIASEGRKQSCELLLVYDVIIGTARCLSYRTIALGLICRHGRRGFGEVTSLLILYQYRTKTVSMLSIQSLILTTAFVLPSNMLSMTNLLTLISLRLCSLNVLILVAQIMILHRARYHYAVS